MLCPSCHEGEVKQILFKPKKKKALICSYCESVWLDGEHVQSPGHTLHSFLPEDGYEYYVDLSADTKQIIDDEIPG